MLSWRQKTAENYIIFLMFCSYTLPEPPVDVPWVDEVHPDILETLRHLHILGTVDEGAAPHNKYLDN
jgi:hypothetical protein